MVLRIIVLRSDIPEARKHRSPSRTPSRTCKNHKFVSNEASRKLIEAQWLHSVPASLLPLTRDQMSLECSIPGRELLKCLFGVRIALPDGRLGKGTLGVPRNGGCSIGRGSHAHSADLRRGTDEGHCSCQLGTRQLQE